jgi:hypothetical protein
MIAALVLVVVAVVCGVAIRWLVDAAWPSRAPRAAIALWQALGLAGGVALIGALIGIGVAPYDAGVLGGVIALAQHALGGDGPALHPGGAPPVVELGHVFALLAGLAVAAVLVGGLVAVLVASSRSRRRHRALLSLVASTSADAPDALLLDHPAAAAYCVPGIRSTIVVSSGAMKMLAPRELAAVMAHERAHAAWRHDLVLLPFRSLRVVLPMAGLVARVCAAVELLVEMAADDQARRRQPARELATALLRVGSAVPAAAPQGALGAAGSDAGTVTMRVSRILHPDPLPVWQSRAVVVAAAVVAVLPMLLIGR